MSGKTNFSGASASSSIAALAAGCLLAAASQAAVIIPTKGGFSGNINLGAGALDVESNTMAKIVNGNIDVGDAKIDSIFNSPDSQSNAIPVVSFELSYTLEKSRTQFHIGNLLEDFLRMEMNLVAGVRQDVGNWGLIGGDLRTTSMPTDVWRDPYIAGEKRKDTERTSKGFRVYWQQIGSSGLELRYTYNDIDIDKERSGEYLGLPLGERKLLRRDGDRDRFDAMYEFSWNGKRHILTPGLQYIDNSLDGDAMSNDGMGANVNYIYKRNEHWTYVINASYADLDYDASNPVYGERDSSKQYGGSVTAFYHEPFGLKKWSLNGTAGFFDADHDIDFFDNSVTIFSVGMFRKF